MQGKVIFPKYFNCRSPILDVHINSPTVPHTLIDLGVDINVMTKDTILKLNLQGSLRKTTTVLQLANHSAVTSKGIIEDVMVSMDSWEYPVEFLVLWPKAKLTGHPLILGRPWLSIVDAYVSCRARNMTIKNGPLSMQLVLYPPSHPFLEHGLPLWLEEEEEDKIYLAQGGTLGNECPLNLIEVDLVCEENDSTDRCPSLHRLKAVYQ